MVFCFKHGVYPHTPIVGELPLNRAILAGFQVLGDTLQYLGFLQTVDFLFASSSQLVGSLDAKLVKL